jgi:CO/xanthine dehydrogenase FAD-binding subunit
MPEDLTPPHAYHRPATLAEAQRLYQECANAAFVAGGTDLFVQMRKGRQEEIDAVISLRNITALSEVVVGDPVRIGASAPVSVIAGQQELRETYPALIEAINVLGSRQIRNVATLGGNLCNASPGADTAPPLLAYEAQVEILAPGGKTRSMPLCDFFLSPGKTTLGAGEILTAVLLPKPSATSRSGFMRRGRIKMDIATAIFSALIEMDGDRCTKARVAVGSVAPTPLRLSAVEKMLEGEVLSDDLIGRASAQAMVDIAPITDLRSTEEYRRDLIGVYCTRTLRSLRGAAQ